MDNLIGDICFKLNSFFNENEAKHLATQQSIIKAAFQHNDETLQELKAKYASLLETNHQLNERIKILEKENSISKILDENARLRLIEENARMIQNKYDEIWNAILKRETRSMRVGDCVKPQEREVLVSKEVKLELKDDPIELKDTNVNVEDANADLVAKLQDEIAENADLKDDLVELVDDPIELKDTKVELKDDLVELNADLNELEETEIELYETTINNKTYYVDNEKNIYEQLPDDEIGEIIGRLDDHNELILN